MMDPESDEHDSNNVGPVTMGPPPATTHGTLVEGGNHGLESLEEYQKGGYHPVHLGDCLGPSKRYRVLHKLGYGGFGTVWLCRDTQDEKYVAVKVMIAYVEPNKLMELTLKELDRSSPGAEHIAIPLDHFSTDGPNGMHQCIVLPVLGPRVSPDFHFSIEGDVEIVLRDLALQATQAMHFLHTNSICHGDFRPSNILLKLRSLDHLSEEEIIALLGQPTKSQVYTESGDPVPPTSPQYLVHPADLSRLESKYITHDICVTDFGELFHMSSPPDDLGMPENYLPPEILLEEEDAVGPACDLWALGCTLFEVRQQIPLFYMIYDMEELLAEMVKFFGKLPDAWWEKWEAREEYFDVEGNIINVNLDKDFTLEVALSKPMEIVRQGENGESKTEITLSTSEEEQKLMADLLYKLMRLEPRERASVDEVLKHEWFRM